jgi:hypothetical protein
MADPSDDELLQVRAKMKGMLKCELISNNHICLLLTFQ